MLVSLIPPFPFFEAPISASMGLVSAWQLFVDVVLSTAGGPGLFQLDR